MAEVEVVENRDGQRREHCASACYMVLCDGNGDGATALIKKNGRRGNIPPYAQAPLVVPKATFFFAMTVMDEVEGWTEEEWVGSKFAASM